MSVLVRDCRVGTATGILFGTVVGYAAHFPAIYVQAVMSGNGVAGLLVALIRIVTFAAIPTDDRTSTVIYFALACAVCLLCLVGFLILRRMDITAFYVGQQTTQKVSAVSRECF